MAKAKTKIKINSQSEGILEVFHIKKAECPLVPWKNAKGQSRELFRNDEEPFLWRLSSAVIREDGPFSDYSEYDRVICLLSGGPVTLSHSGGKKRNLEILVPYKFPGDLPTHAHIDSLAEDFNLFLLKGKAKGTIYPTFFKTGEEYQLPLSACEHFIYCVRGSLTVVERDSQKSILLGEGDLFRAKKTGTREYPNLKVISSMGAGAALWIPIHLSSK